MSIEELIKEHTAALNRNSDCLERVIAGQQAALDKIEGPKTTTRGGRGSKKDETPAAEAPATEQTGGDAAPAYTLPTFADVDAFKAHVSKWTSEVEGDARAPRVAFLRAVAANFGGEGFSGAFSGGAKAVFFIERAKALGPEAVDFNADYDFDGDPSQGGATPAAPAKSEDDFG